MMTGELIGVLEYLSTSCGPDCDSVDGVVEERNVGPKDDTKLQRQLLVCYDNRAENWGIQVFPEQRIRVSPTRFRVADVGVIAGPEPDEQVFHTLDPEIRKACRWTTAGRTEVSELRTENPDTFVFLEALFE